MDVFAAIADERRALSTLLCGISEQQQREPSLCSGWTVHDVVAHLVLPSRSGCPLSRWRWSRTRGNFDRANVHLTSKQARRPFHELIAVLQQKAESRFTPPGAGAEAPLTDVLVHGLDIRWPLHLDRQVPHERTSAALAWLTAPKGGVLPSGSLAGLRFVATDLDWEHGNGPTVGGRSDALLLALTGRTVALDHLDGDGVPVLRQRVTSRRGR
ncbi:maleylpyruvate isomerase family mycothiol-dependent enzyme [Nocardioides zeae]